MKNRALLYAIILIISACTTTVTRYDLLIENGIVYDGNGGQAYVADIGVNGDRVVAIGQLRASANDVINAEGLVVAPGFINMLSWATDSLIIDGRSQGDIRQGVTLEVFGEGRSEGPLNEAMREQTIATQGDIKWPVEWTTLDEYLEFLVERGVSPNVASFVGATSVRVHEIGYDDRPPTAAELERMKNLVREAMEDGALGLGSSLIYAPAFYADTEELIALAEVVGEYNGIYISHMRSEGNRLLESVDELIRIAREGNVGAEIYHLKMAGQQNWDKFDAVVEKVESARAGAGHYGRHLHLHCWLYWIRCKYAPMGSGGWL